MFNDDSTIDDMSIGATSSLDCISSTHKCTRALTYRISAIEKKDGKSIDYILFNCI